MTLVLCCVGNLPFFAGHYTGCFNVMMVWKKSDVLVNTLQLGP